MLRRFMCCFNSKTNHNSKCLDLEEISVREDTTLNFASLYDSNDWLNKLDKPDKIDSSVAYTRSQLLLSK